MGIIAAQQVAVTLDTSFPSENIKSFLGGTLEFRFKAIENGAKVKIYVKRTGSGWIGLGFGNGMTDTDWVFIRRDGNVPVLTDCSFLNSVANCNESEQGWTLTSPTSYISQGSTIELEMVRSSRGSGNNMDKNLGSAMTEWTWAAGDNEATNDGKPANGHSPLNRGRFQLTLPLGTSLLQSGVAVVLLAFLAKMI